MSSLFDSSGYSVQVTFWLPVQILVPLWGAWRAWLMPRPLLRLRRSKRRR